MKKVEKKLILEACKLNKSILDSRENTNFWNNVSIRKLLAYDHPLGWIGYGINIDGKYDNGNNDWTIE